MEAGNNKKIYIGIAVLCAIVILIAGGVYFLKNDKNASENNKEKINIASNETGITKNKKASDLDELLEKDNKNKIESLDKNENNELNVVKESKTEEIEDSNKNEINKSEQVKELSVENNKDKIEKLNEINKEETEKLIRKEKAKELVNVSVELIAAKNYDLAEKKLMDALRYDPEQSVAYCNLAVIDINKNDIEASLENLETCFMKEPSYIDLVKKDPDYKVLWDDRRFKAIINRYK